MPARAASPGKCSHIEIPGTAVAIGLNSPRNPSGAAGFMSNESRWESPPVKKTRITDFARGWVDRPRPLVGSAASLRTATQKLSQPQPQKPREPHLDELAANKPNRMPMRLIHSCPVFQLDAVHAVTGSPALLLNRILTWNPTSFHHKLSIVPGRGRFLGNTWINSRAGDHGKLSADSRVFSRSGRKAHRSPMNYALFSTDNLLTLRPQTVVECRPAPDRTQSNPNRTTAMRSILATVASLTCTLVVAAISAADPAKSFQGEWRTTIGIVKLQQKGSAVTGTYGIQRPVSDQRNVKDNVLTFEYDGRGRPRSMASSRWMNRATPSRAPSRSATAVAATGTAGGLTPRRSRPRRALSAGSG